MTRKRITIAIVIIAMLYNFIFDIVPFPVYAAEVSVPTEGQSTPTPSVVEGEGESTPTPGVVEGEGQSTPTPGVVEGEGQSTPTPGVIEGEGQSTPTPGVIEGEGQSTPTPGTPVGEQGALNKNPESEVPLLRLNFEEDEEIIISTKDELLELQEQSQIDSLTGKTITLANTEEIRTFPDEFTGLGNEEYPFCGTIQSYYTEGVVYTLKTPLVRVLGNGAVIKQFKTETTAPLVGSIMDGATLTYDNVVISGEITADDHAGTIAGTIGSNVTLTLNKVDLSGVKKVSSQSAAAGGIAGVLGADAIVTATDGVPLPADCTIEGNTHAGGYFGIVQNGFVWDTDTFWFANGLTLSGKSSKCSSGLFAGELQKGTLEIQSVNQDRIELAVNIVNNFGGNGGGLIGIVYGGTSVKSYKSLQLTSQIGYNTNIKGGSYAGGVFGSIAAGDSSFQMELPEGGSITVNACLYGNAAAGGYAGRIEADTEIPDITIHPITESAARICAVDTVGGIIGMLSGAKVLIHTPTVEAISLYNTKHMTYGGGIIGTIIEGAAEISGSQVTVSDLILEFGANNLKYGYIVGKQKSSFVYFSDPNVTLTMKMKENKKSPKGGTTIYEVGGIGGVYRNKALDVGVLIGNGSLEGVGTLNLVLPKNGSAYQFSDEIGFECFSIATNSKGRYGKEAFQQSGTDGEFLTHILGAAYEIPSSQEIDLSYSNTGIVTLDLNDPNKDLNERFQGSVKGTAGQAVLKQDMDGISVDKRENVGLFSGLTGATEFENLTLTGTVDMVAGVGGLAYDIKEGTSLTLKNIIIEKTFGTNCTNDIGGLIARQEKGTDDFSLVVDTLDLQSTITVNNKSCSGFITEMNTAVLDIRNVTLGGSYQNTSTDTELGGFLGSNWTKIYGTVDGITVLENTSYEANGCFGVLLGKVSSRTEAALGLQNRLTIKNADLNHLSVTASNTDDAIKKYSALLVRDGSSLVMSVENYSCAGCTVNGIVPDKFDEIVGYQNEVEAGLSYGVVSLHQDTKSFPIYFYQYMATYPDVTSRLYNNRTRYYYDVFQKLQEDHVVTYEGTTAVLDSPEDLFLWSILTYSKNDQVGTFKKIAGNPANFTDRISKIKLDGTINLTGYSFYPLQESEISVDGNGATVLFDAESILDTVENGSIPSKNPGQHYSLQAGLLRNIPNGCKVSDLTLSGTISRMIGNDGIVYTGALVCGSMNSGDSAVAEFKNITAKDLTVKGYAALTANDTDGLLIGHLQSGTTSFQEIKTQYTNSSEAVAAALIGRGGSEKETRITIGFRNMDIDSKKNDKVFRHASFLYYFDHEDSGTYSGYGRYLFTEEEARTMVTYGCEPELNVDTEYWWESTEIDPHKGVIDTTGINSADYLPYTYTGDQLLVNPKPVEITSGCGTYEDPYVISDEKQFLMLYKYLNEDIDSNREFLDGFIMNDIGDDASFCDGQESSHTQQTFRKDGNNPDFPTQDELSYAYYRLAADIDLSTVTGNYAVFAKNFSGFGSLERPFCGVWYGKGSDGTIYKVILPDKTTSSGQDSFGFLRYANGAVLKDMKIQMTGTADIIGCGGLAIGCVYGGDNIIDNVTVSGKLGKTNSSLPEIGGLVGCVRKGGLILRNLTADSVSGFTCRLNEAYPYQGMIVGSVYDGYVLHDDSGNSEVISRLNEINGKAAIHDYTLLNENYFETHTAGLSVVKSGTDITVTIPNETSLMLMTMALNSDSLQIMHTDCTDAEELYSFGYTQNSRTRKAKYSAIGNSTDETPDYLAAATYDNRMNGSDGADSANDAYAYPYLYQYMNIDKTNYRDFVRKQTTAQGETGLISILNDYGNPEGSSDAYDVQWLLKDGGATTYDMTIFGESFRGIGAIYQVGGSVQNGKNYAGTFHGNFDGKNNIIHYEINRDTTKRTESSKIQNLSGAIIDFYALDYAGLFNYLSNGEDIAKTIENVKLSGSIDTLREGNYNNNTDKAVSLVGGVLVGIQVGAAKLTISNVEVLPGFKIGQIITTQTSYNELSNVRKAGGIIGEVIGTGENKNTSIELKNCKVIGEETNPIVLSGETAAGGMIGSISNYVAEMICENGEVAFTQITATGTVAASSNAGYSTYGTAGGVIGYSLSKLQEDSGVPFACTISKTSVSDSTISSSSDSGGMIGNAEPANGSTDQGQIHVKDGTVERCTVSGMRSVGGVVGSIGTNARARFYSGHFEDTKVIDTVVQYQPIRSDLTIELSESSQGIYVGGVLGFYGVSTSNNTSYHVSMENVQVYGTAENQSKILIQPSDAKLLTHVTIKSGKASALVYAGAGGLVGGSSGNIQFLGCTGNKESVKNVDIYAEINDIAYYGAGGILGFARGINKQEYAATYFPKSNDHMVKVSGCKVIVSEDKDPSVQASWYYGAGGVFGVSQSAVLGEMGSDSETEASNLTCLNNTISGYYAGGIGGLAQSIAKLHQIHVEGGAITGAMAAGGMIAYSKYDNVRDTVVNYLTVTTDGSTKNLIKNVQITGQNVGGVYGTILAKANNAKYKVIIDGVQVQNCTIQGKRKSGYRAVGGVIGNDQWMPMELYDITIDNNVFFAESTPNTGYLGGLIGYILTNYKTQTIFCDQITIKKTNKFGVTHQQDSELNLYKKTSNVILENLTSEVIGNELEGSQHRYEDLKKIHRFYGYGIGSFIGSINISSTGSKTGIYMIHSTVEYPDITDPSRNGFDFPVTDVGYYVTDPTDTAEIVHIMYGNSANETGEGNLSVMKAKTDYAPLPYENSPGSFEELLSSYSLNDETNEGKPMGQISSFKNSYPLIVSDQGREYTGKILRYRIENSTLQQFVEDMADIMTNVSGIPSTTMQILNVTAEPMQWDIDTDQYTKITTKEASIQPSKTGDAWSFDFNDGHYDTISNGKVTYTELRFTYGWSDYKGNWRKQEYALPIYVEEPIKTYVQSTIVADQVSVLEDIRTQGKTNVELANQSITMINDSDYTLLLEYFYGNGRKKKEDAVVDKIFSLDAVDGSCFEQGTRLMLIDVTNGNQVYYYPAVKEGDTIKVDWNGMPGDVSKIHLSDFIGMDGEPYTNQPISQLPDVEEGKYVDADGKSLNGYGMEQYLLYVIKPKGTRETRAYKLHTELDTGEGKTTELIKKALYGVREADITVDSIPGITIALNKTGSATKVEGSMSKNTLITVDATIDITAEAFYWAQVQLAEILDGANYDKYLDVRISLKDQQGNRISLPEGTNFRFKMDGAEESAYSPYQSVAGDSIYYYKDTGTKEFKIRGQNGITQNTTLNLRLQLNFENADLVPYTDSEYTICMDLIRSTDPKEPEGTKDDTMDENWHYERTVKAVLVPSLGFAIRVPEEQQNMLAVNTYDCNTTGTHVIPFTVEYDFNDILNAVVDSEKANAIKKWSDYKYEVTFELFPKDAGGYEETQEGRYQGNGMSLEVNNGVATEVTANGGKQTYTITEEQIRENTSADAKPIVWDGNQILLDLATLTGWSGDDLSNLTNYKLKATLRVTSLPEEEGIISTEAEILTTSDFFIYTVTKLKTSAKGNG